MGLTNVTFGNMITFAVVTLPQMLAAQGVPGGHIAAITAIMGSPAWWAPFFAPILDVRFRRRTYALALGLVAAFAAAFSAYDHQNVPVIEILVFIGSVAVAFYQGAVGGWMGSLIERKQDGLLGTWFTAASIAAGGLIAMSAGPVIFHAPPILAAAFIFLAVALPMLFFLAIPAPPPDQLLAAESFGRFWREVLSLFKRREVLIGIILFVLPSASFALTNILAGLGTDYHASSYMVSLLSGVGYIVAGGIGMFLVPQLAKKFSLRPLYLAIGVVGALFTLCTLLLPHAPFAFAIAFAGELTFQALSFTVATSIIFEIIGPDNPLAATTFTLLFSIMFLPVSYMGFLDGWGYDRGGLVACFAVDAGISMIACLILAMVLRKWLFAPHPTEAA